MTRTVSIDVAAGAVPTLVQGPEDASAVPALLIVPSIFGPATDLLERLESLEGEALVVAPDPFWRTGEGPLDYDQMDTAFGRLADFDMTACLDEMTAVVEWARAQGSGRVVGLGICFGGPFVIRLAARGLLDGIVTWHGSRMEQALRNAGDITCPVRHHLGGDDSMASPEVITALENAFADNDDTEIVVHPGAGHGFSHDGDAWDAAAYAAGHASVVSLLRG